MSAPTPDEIAELLQVEYLLDQRWPETKIEPSTVRIEALLEMLGSPQRGYPSIHVAGTNGKTSVTRMIDALLTAFSRRTGRTTSPHLQSAVERIAVDDQPISPARYVETYREIEPYVLMVDEQSLTGAMGEPGPAMSKFEVLTAMAFAVFAEAPVDVAVTGVKASLGGELRLEPECVGVALVDAVEVAGVGQQPVLRRPLTDQAAHAPGTVNIPLSDLGERLAEIPRGAPVVVGCASEIGRAHV